MKSKKIKSMIIAIVFIIITTITSHSFADVGSFESYDSGSSWSSSSSDYGSSSWSSSDYDSPSWSSSDYGSSRSSSNYGKGSSFEEFLSAMITFAILIAILIYIAKKSKGNPPYMSKQQGINTPNVTDLEREKQVEAKIKEVDPMFNKEEFIANAKSLFVKLQQAWTDRDWSVIRVFETNELFEQHKNQLQGYINNGTINVMDRICVNYAKLNKFYQTSDKDILKIALNSSMVDYIKDEKTGNVLKGNTETRLTHTYILTFVRKRGVLTQAGGPKVASANCPNCGAPTKVALAGKCEYCGSLIKIEDHGWVLSNLERM